MHTLGGCPPAQLARELHANDLGALELPGDARHHVHGISAADANADTAEAAAVGRVRVRTNHQKARVHIVLRVAGGRRDPQ